MRLTTALGNGSRTATGTAARHLVPLIEELLGRRLPLKLRAWDGSGAGSGPEDGPDVVLHHRRTAGAWHRTLEERWDRFAALVGQETARGRWLCLAGGAPAFEERRMGVDQILAVRPSDTGRSGMQGTPRDRYAR